MAYYMGRHKSAISITLDNNVLDFFSGKGRSGKINYILQQYLRAQLGGDVESWNHERTNRQQFGVALNVVIEQFGNDSTIAGIMKKIYEAIE